MKRVNLIALLFLTFSVGVFLTSYLTPTYAADPTTFFSCEVGGGGCSIRLNTTDHIVLNSTQNTYLLRNISVSGDFISDITMSNADIILGGNLLNTSDITISEEIASILTIHRITDDRAGNLYLRPTGTSTQSEFRLFSTSDIVTNTEYLRLLSGATHIISSVKAAGGTLRPLEIQMASDSIITFSIINTIDFHSRTTSNIGHAGNDFDAGGNSLIATTMSGAITSAIGGNSFGSTTFSGNVNIGGNQLQTNDLLMGEELVSIMVLRRITDDRSASLYLHPTGTSPTAELRLFSTSDISTNTEYIRFRSGTTHVLSSVKAATGTLRPFQIEMATNAIITFTTGNAIQFNDREMEEIGNMKLTTNNTMSLFEDAVRVADAFFVVSHIKSQVTDLQLEAEYKPDLTYSYNNGDVVCLKEWKIFTRCNSTYNKILGPIFMLRIRGITGTENITNYNMELVNDVLKNISSIEQINKWEIIDYEPVIVVEGPFLVKTCIPIMEGQLLLAGGAGCVIGVDSYSDVPPLMFVIGYAAYDSKGGYVESVIL